METIVLIGMVVPFDKTNFCWYNLITTKGHWKGVGMNGEVLCTRKDFERARAVILNHLQRDGVDTRRNLSKYRQFGIPYEAIELAVRYLKSKGIIEELYTLPKDQGVTGKRKEYLALTVALDAKSVELPDNVVRVADAMKRIADYQEAEAV